MKMANESWSPAHYEEPKYRLTAYSTMLLLIGLSLALDAILLGAFVPLELTKRRLRRDREEAAGYRG